MKKYIAAALCAGVFLTSNAGLLQAAQKYYEVTTKQNISKGVTYQTSTRVVEGGMLDVYVLTIPLDNPYLTLAPVTSAVEYGLKEPTSKLLTDSGAIAGVNGDYFGIAGTHSVPLGTQISGQNQSLTESFNQTKLESATFFLTDTDTPFIDYMQTDIQLLIDGAEIIPIASINKTVSLAYPTIFTYDTMQNTAAIDARIKDTYKIVVVGKEIVRVSRKGETVNVPQTGFIIAMNADAYEKYQSKIEIAQRVEIRVKSNVDVSKIKTAISGAGKILDNGAVSSSGAVISGRHPRTAIGITKDEKSVILMVVDGRTHSIGANQQEMADLMLEYGAYNAMHFDGGGSSTMAVKFPNTSGLSVVNTPSDSTQRKVINAFGLFDSSPVGDITALEIVADKDVVVTAMPSKITVYGLDDYFHRIQIPQEEVALSCPDATIFDGHVIPTASGENIVTAQYMGLTATKRLRSLEIAEIRPNAASIVTIVGKSTPISFTGVSRNGFSVAVDTSAISYEVFPQDLGFVQNGTFVSVNPGFGYIKCSFGNIETYVAVDATISALVIDTLDGATKLAYSGYPETVTGEVSYTSGLQAIGHSSVKLDYTFLSSSDTQAAYVNFSDKAQATYNAKGFRIAVYGDASKHWLRGKITDATGVSYTVDFARTIDFMGWKDLDVMVPQGAVYPVTLERIYVASLSETSENSHTIYFDNLRGFYPQDEQFTRPEIPEPTKAKDELSASFAGTVKSGYDITFMGGLAGYAGAKPANYDANRKKAVAALAKDSLAAVYGGAFDISPETGVKTYLHDGGYKAYVVNDLTIIKMFAANGGFSLTDASQWAKLKNDIFASATQNIVIQTDNNPMYFKYSQEYTLFQNLLADAAEMGKNIFVVSSQGAFTTSSMHEGVRYINLGSLYDGENLNATFSILRFRINGNNIKYSIEPVFN